MALKDYIASEVALDCAEGVVSRREALRRLGLMGVTGAAAAALLAACGGDDTDTTPTTTVGSTTTSAPATTAAPPATTGGAAGGDEIRFTGPNGELIGVLTQAADPRGAVLVIHENRGLTPHIRSVASRLAASG